MIPSSGLKIMMILLVGLASLLSSCVSYYPDPELLFRVEYCINGQHVEEFEYYQPPKKSFPFPSIKVDLGLDDPRPVFRYDGDNWYFISIPNYWINDIYFSIIQSRPYALGKNYALSDEDVLWIIKGGLSSDKNRLPTTLEGSYSFKVGKDKYGEYEAFLFSFDELLENTGEVIEIRDGVLFHYVKNLSKSGFFNEIYVSEE